MPPLLERDRDFEQVRSAVDSARDGVGATVMVWGPAGIGKSSLLAAAVEYASGLGVRVLRARGAELEREFGFGLVRQLFEPALAAASDAERSQWLDGAANTAARILGLPGIVRDSVEDAMPADMTFAILHGLYWLTAQVAGSGPVCLVIDDAQWSDLASMRFLEFLHLRLTELPVVVIAAVRTGEVGAVTAPLNRFAADSITEVLELAPLTRDGVGRLLTAGLGRPAEQTLVSRCLLATGGNPFLVEQVVAQLRDNGQGTAPNRDIELQAGPTVARWTRTRLARLGPDAQRLANAVAVLEVAGLSVAAELAQLTPEAAADASTRLADTEILNSVAPLQFVHPLVRRAVYDGIGPADRAMAHRRAALLLMARGSPDELIAEHLLATEPSASAWVVERLVLAAAAAAGTGAFDSAAAYLRRALAEPPSPDELSTILLSLGHAEWNVGDDDSVGHLRDGTAAADGPARAEGAVTLAYALAAVRHPRLADAEQVLDDTIAVTDPADADTVRRLQTAASSIAALDARLATRDPDRIRAALARADDPDAGHEVLALAAFVATLSNEPASRVRQLLRRTAHSRPGRFPGPADSLGAGAIVVHTMNALVCSEDPSALDAINDTLDNARRSGTGPMVACALVFRAQLALQHGDLRAAESDSAAAFGMSQMPIVGYMHVLNTAVTLHTLIEQGRGEDAERFLSEADAIVLGTTTPDARLMVARGCARLAQQRPAEALEDFLDAGNVAAGLGMDSPSWLPWRSNAALARLALGEHDAARELAGTELDLARRFGAPRTLGIALRVAGLTVDGAPGERLLRAAIEQLGGSVVDRARAQCDLGARLRRDNRRAESRDLLRAGLDAAHRAGAADLARQAGTELRAAGGRPRLTALTGAAALTASERRVVDLAVDGLTNRRIAQSLFVTERTVEGHLTAAFRKLGVTSRDELAAALTDG